MFGVFAIKHPGSVEVSNRMGVSLITATQYVVLFKTQISQVSSVFNETAFCAVLSMSSFCAEGRLCNFPQNSGKGCL